MLSESAKAQFIASLRRVLRPIVRQAIAFGVSYPALSRLLKQLYVDVADGEFALPFKRGTDSRAALLTGISRREIAALRGKSGAEAEAASGLEDSAATHAVGHWMAGPPYATPRGTPRRLRYEADDPKQPTFAALIRSLSVDIPVRAVLDELIRIGSVRLHDNGDVELVGEANIPVRNIEEMLAVLGSAPAELYTTIAHNIERQDEPWLQRKVAYDNIGSEALAALRAEARAAGEEFVRRANALLASYDLDRHPDAPGGERSRVALGVYYFEEVAAAQPPRKSRHKAGGPPGRIQKNNKKRR
jgi:hypothetical protein